MPWWGIPLVLIAPFVGVAMSAIVWWCIAHLIRIDPW